MAQKKVSTVHEHKYIFKIIKYFYTLFNFHWFKFFPNNNNNKMIPDYFKLAKEHIISYRLNLKRFLY